MKTKQINNEKQDGIISKLIKKIRSIFDKKDTKMLPKETKSTPREGNEYLESLKVDVKSVTPSEITSDKTEKDQEIEQ